MATEMNFRIWQGATNPVRFTLTDANGPVDLTGKIVRLKIGSTNWDNSGFGGLTLRNQTTYPGQCDVEIDALSAGSFSYAVWNVGDDEVHLYGTVTVTAVTQL